MSDPMTAEEIAAAREWIGLGHEELSDSEIVDGVKHSLWLATRRADAALSKLKEVFVAEVRANAANLRRMLTGER